MKNLLLVNGSLGESSYCEAIINAIKVMKNNPVAVADFRQLNLPFELPQYHKAPEQFPDNNVQVWLDMIKHAHSLILVSPLYHGSISGVLKNALDLLAYDQLRGKKVGVIIQCGNVRAGATACVHIRSIIRTLYGTNIQTHIITGAQDFTLINNQKSLQDNEITLRLSDMLEQLET
ncbi:NADPH-dependent FMN reductase [Cysteiniphilum sp. 6C5]|uniref:NADPH-dependent FMN reductase n=1 Tax=unclassified Cysteiniphilum TaxID=2610889 RepID=UPI003F876EBF